MPPLLGNVRRRPAEEEAAVGRGIVELDEREVARLTRRAQRRAERCAGIRQGSGSGPLQEARTYRQMASSDVAGAWLEKQWFAVSR